MSAIDKIILRNFKAFNDTSEISLNGNHLLMFGENGSGKSSIYWAIYTLLQSANKNQTDIAKYFTPNNPENLINYNYLSNLPGFTIDAEGNIDNPQSIGLNAYVEVLFTTREKIIINSQGITCFIWDDEDKRYIEDNEYGKTLLDNLNRSSDFISHRLLINFYNFRNSKEINLWEVFVRDIFPFLQIGLGAGNNSLGNILSDILTNKPFYDFSGNTFKLRRSNHWSRIQYEEKIENFNNELDNWIDEINPMVNDFYNNYFKNSNDQEIKVVLDYDKKLSFDNVTQNAKQGNNTFYLWAKYHVDLNNPSIKFTIKTKDANDNWIVITRPQSYFNEAKLTQIALSVRLAFTLQRMVLFKGQILALDDLLVSLDMGNRDKVLDIILDLFANNYKIYLFTHEKNFFDFCVFKIEQRKKKEYWGIMEIYSGETNLDKPIIISSVSSPYDKALKYFKAKDYTTCSLYLRKELEKLVIERLPEEYTKTIDGQFHNLEHYWKLFIERYIKLNKEISVEIKEYFKQSKLLILNPAAHHNLNLPVYKLELERAFFLVESIYNDYPIPNLNILLCKGMTLIFKHPTENYTFELELQADLATNSIDTGNEITNPKCKILGWQFKGIDLWDFNKNTISNYDVEKKPMLHSLDQVIKTHINHIPLIITIEIFLHNTKIKYTNTSLNELFLNNKITYYYNFITGEIVFNLIYE